MAKKTSLTELTTKEAMLSTEAKQVLLTTMAFRQKSSRRPSSKRKTYGMDLLALLLVPSERRSAFE